MGSCREFSIRAVRPRRRSRSRYLGRASTQPSAQAGAAVASRPRTRRMDNPAWQQRVARCGGQTVALGRVGNSRSEPSAPAASPALAIMAGPRPGHPPKQAPPWRAVLDLGASIIPRGSSLVGRLLHGVVSGTPDRSRPLAEAPQPGAAHRAAPSSVAWAVVCPPRPQPPVAPSASPVDWPPPASPPLPVRPWNGTRTPSLPAWDVTTMGRRDDHALQAPPPAQSRPTQPRRPSSRYMTSGRDFSARPGAPPVTAPRRKSTASDPTLCRHRRRTLAPAVQAHTSAAVRGTVAGQFSMAPPDQIRMSLDTKTRPPNRWPPAEHPGCPLPAVQALVAWSPCHSARSRPAATWHWGPTVPRRRRRLGDEERGCDGVHLRSWCGGD